MNWIPHPVVLKNDLVKLAPLESSYFDELLRIAKAPEIWVHMTFNGLDEEKLLNELRSSVLRKMTNEEYPFTIFDNRNDRIIGSTRLYNMFPTHRKLEIGWTWYDPEYWGTGYNTACKLLLLSFCFETLNTVRVQLQTNEHNLRSRAAIQKIGATFEGILRHDRINGNGTIRNTAMFSIINSEWESIKKALEEQVAAVSQAIQ